MYFKIEYKFICLNYYIIKKVSSIYKYFIEQLKLMRFLNFL